MDLAEHMGMNVTIHFLNLSMPKVSPSKSNALATAFKIAPRPTNKALMHQLFYIKERYPGQGFCFYVKELQQKQAISNGIAINDTNRTNSLKMM